MPNSGRNDLLLVRTGLGLDRLRRRAGGRDREGGRAICFCLYLQWCIGSKSQMKRFGHRKSCPYTAPGSRPDVDDPRLLPTHSDSKSALPPIFPSVTGYCYAVLDKKQQFNTEFNAGLVDVLIFFLGT